MSALNNDPVYRGLVSECRRGELPVGVLNDYRMDKGFKPLKKNMSPVESLRLDYPISAYDWIRNLSDVELEEEKIEKQKKQQERERKSISWISDQRESVVELGEWYHSNVRKLYRSKYGEVLYGWGQNVVKWNVYSKRIHSLYGPYRCRGGSVVLTGCKGKAEIIVINHKGETVLRMKYPVQQILKKTSLLEWFKDQLKSISK
jgi:hypothetical protein